MTLDEENQSNKTQIESIIKEKSSSNGSTSNVTPENTTASEVNVNLLIDCVNFDNSDFIFKAFDG
jgi:hypothetical protein